MLTVHIDRHQGKAMSFFFLVKQSYESEPSYESMGVLGQTIIKHNIL